MIESTVLSPLAPHHTARANKLQAEEGRIKKGQNKSNLNTNGQKPQTEKKKKTIHKNLEQNFIS
jgi:hypothetical protein